MQKKKYEMVKYNQDLELFPWKITALEMDLLVVLFVVLRNRIKGSRITITIRELKRLSGRTSITSDERFINQLKELNEHLKEMDTKIMIYGSYVKFDIFRRFIIDEKNKTLEVELKSMFIYIVNRFDLYTSFALDQFLSLKSKYSKTIFRYLESFRKEGIWSVSVGEFRRLVDVPESYEMKKVVAKIIKPAIKELDAYYEALEFTLVKNGTKAVRITFAYECKK